MPDIMGYRQLSGEEIDTINRIKQAENELSGLWGEIANSSNVDRRWTAIAKTHFQEGFSALVRSVARPEDVWQ
jgi:hypothetical protein